MTIYCTWFVIESHLSYFLQCPKDTLIVTWPQYKYVFLCYQIAKRQSEPKTYYHSKVNGTVVLHGCSSEDV
jgi:hypothetical protein